MEFLQGGHNFNATLSGVSVTNTSGQATLTGLASTAGISVGMSVSGTNVAAGSVVASVDSATQITMSKVSTGAVTSATFTADTFKLLLINASPARTYDHTQTNVGTPGTGTPSASNVGTDEVAASGTYVSGGATLTNVAPILSSTTACVSFSNVSFTSATISTSAAIIYNSSNKQGAASTPISGRAVEVLDFGGTQSVSGGTLTLSFPTQNSTSSVLRIA